MIKLITPPTTEPINLEEAKMQLRVDSSSEDSLITNLIKAAREYCEDFQHRAFITQTLEITFNRFPLNEIINIPKGNLKEVKSFIYTTTDNVQHELIKENDFTVSLGDYGKIAPLSLWPKEALFKLDPIKIQFICGYGEAKDIPQKIKQAMLMLISYWYDNRSAASSESGIPKQVEFSVSSLLKPYKLPLEVV